MRLGRGIRAPDLIDIDGNRTAELITDDHWLISDSAMTELRITSSWSMRLGRGIYLKVTIAACMVILATPRNIRQLSSTRGRVDCRKGDIVRWQLDTSIS